MDGVFNHASRGLFQFNDILENGPHSPWLGWFTIHGWPLAPYDGHRPANYSAWADNRALPEFNTDNPEVQEFLMQIGEFWVREYDIDGWRLDVPADIKTPGFWEEFRRRVRAVKHDAYLVGEIWRDAPLWLRGDRFDATMNYVFAAAAIAFAAGNRVSPSLVKDRSYDVFPGLNAAQFGQRIDRLVGQYDWQTTLVQFNLLDSHDTARVLSIARGDKATLRLATLLQMTFPGAPASTMETKSRCEVRDVMTGNIGIRMRDGHFHGMTRNSGTRRCCSSFDRLLRCDTPMRLCAVATWHHFMHTISSMRSCAATIEKRCWWR